MCSRQMLMQGAHVDHEPILHITFQHALVGSIDVIHRDYFNVGDDLVLRAEIQHFLSFPDAADKGTRQLTALQDEVEYT